MSDKRSHRGHHPEDPRLFAVEQWAVLQNAVADLSWLLSHDYAINSALKLVGDRYQLEDRQRLAVFRSACSDHSLAERRAREVPLNALAGQTLLLDGYNVLTTIEAALGGGILVRGRDCCLRDMASMHGHYKRVAETAPALEFLGTTLADVDVARAEILLDSPVSNSGRLKTIMKKTAADHGWPWEITLVPDPDPVLARSDQIVATADSVILAGTRNPNGTAPPRWANLAAHIVQTQIPTATIIPMTR